MKNFILTTATIALTLFGAQDISAQNKVAADELPTHFKIANRWSLKVMAQSGDTVVYREFDDNVNDIWTLNQATDTTVEIINVGTGLAMEMENVAAYPEMSTVTPTWLSQKWIIEQVEDTVFSIRSAWYGHYYLNVEGQAGYVENSAIDPAWWSAQWTIVPIEVEQDTTGNEVETGIWENASNAALNVWPNPASNMVNISMADQVDQISVYDLTGQLVMVKQNLNSKRVLLDISQLNSGVHLMKVVDNAGRVGVTRFIAR